ncbi:S8 family peptidase [Amycolatopsis sp. CA-230715]|uniref:S8 family peptidase n=1 Tax=Amycolatopsis sp. CA-230715 TaxID=2745196 RepID=UPI001C00FC87|nr:S8 family serine peptidase [Amycolatopsis sp. CA-230715]QWF77406.1 hypothetical protein HUW46_00798 [Amycolatopsis sp. CA-230715]
MWADSGPVGGAVALLGPVRRVAAVTLVLCAQLVGFPAAHAQGQDCSASGRAARYVVVFDKGTSADSAARQIGAACGEETTYYPQIAVGVATSTDEGFAANLGLDRAFSAQAERRAAPHSHRTGKPASVAAAGAVPVADRSGDQWDMRAIGAAWPPGRSPGSRSVVVGVLDSGIDATHPDLAAAIVPGKSAGCLTGAPDPDQASWLPGTSSHGTHVAGTIAAANDGKGVTGVAPGVGVASVKVVDDHGYVDPEAAVCGLMWAAAQHMRVTNSSFSVDPWGLSCARGDDHGVVHEALARAVEYSTASGTLNVAAATNEAVNLTPSPKSGTPPGGTGCEALPAGFRDVVTVSAIGTAPVKAGYSSYGLGVIDLTAPGGDDRGCVLSTVPGGYAPMCGTSMAAPHVAGVAALLASARPEAGPRALRSDLEHEAKPVPCPGDYDLTGDGDQDAFCDGYSAYNGFYGHGLVDAAAAVPAAPVTDFGLARLTP